MNPTTQSRIRSAAVDALTEGDDACAFELLQILRRSSPPDVPPPVPPQSHDSGMIREGPPHDYHFWTQFLRERFIPFLVENGRPRFTAHELLSWLEHLKDLPLTTGDMAMHCDGRTITWKSQVSSALRALKQQGHLDGQRHSKVYEVRRVMAACSDRGLSPGGLLPASLRP